MVIFSFTFFNTCAYGRIITGVSPIVYVWRYTPLYITRASSSRYNAFLQFEDDLVPPPPSRTWMDRRGGGVDCYSTSDEMKWHKISNINLCGDAKSLERVSLSDLPTAPPPHPHLDTHQKAKSTWFAFVAPLDQSNKWLCSLWAESHSLNDSGGGISVTRKFVVLKLYSHMELLKNRQCGAIYFME